MKTLAIMETVPCPCCDNERIAVKACRVCPFVGAVTPTAVDCVYGDE